MKNYYLILDVESDATMEQIRAAIRTDSLAELREQVLSKAHLRIAPPEA